MTLLLSKKKPWWHFPWGEKKRLKKKIIWYTKKTFTISSSSGIFEPIMHKIYVSCFKLCELYNHVKPTCYEKEYAYIYNAQDTLVFLKGKLVSAFCVHPYLI